MNESWEEPKEDDGLTLGPEESLQKEIEKSKALKVDQLRLRDDIEKLRLEKEDLAQKNQLLKERLAALGNSTSENQNPSLPKMLIIALALGLLTCLWIMMRN